MFLGLWLQPRVSLLVKCGEMCSREQAVRSARCCLWEGAGTLILWVTPHFLHAVLQPDLLDTDTGFGGQAAEEPPTKFGTVAECCNILLLFLLNNDNNKNNQTTTTKPQTS